MMDQKTQKMLQGPLLSQMILFALPVAAGGILQQLFNAVDTAVVGRFASSQALAAVGANASVVGLLVVVFSSMSVGSSVIIAQDLGALLTDEISDAVHTSIAFALVSGFGLLIFGQVIARTILTMISTPADIMDLAIVYLRIYCLGMPFIMLYNFASAILRSSGDTRRPVLALIIAGFLNVILNLIFVIVFHLSVVGVALATVISNIVSGGLVVYCLMIEDGPLRYRFRKTRFHKGVLIRLLKIGLPAGIQGLVFSLSNVFIQSGINVYGSDVVAGSAVALNFEYMTYYIINGFNQAALTFIGQNYGAGNFKRCHQIFKVAFVSAVCGVLIVNGFYYLSHGLILSLFTKSHKVIYYATQRMHYVLLFQWFAATYEVSGSSMRAYGYSLTPAVLTIFGTCVLRIIWVFIVKVKELSFITLMIVYPVSWIVTGILVTSAYFMSVRHIEFNAQRHVG